MLQTVLFAEEGSTFTGVEILQEAVERYLKGFLIAKGWTLQKVHDLTVLNDEAKRFGERFGLFDELCESLTERSGHNIMAICQLLVLITKRCANRLENSSI